MSLIRFTWDPKKAGSNLAKHGVSFEAVRTAFHDENARLIRDPDHSDEEDRFILLGYSHRARCLVISHCYRESVVRLISARPATPREESA